MLIGWTLVHVHLYHDPLNLQSRELTELSFVRIEDRQELRWKQEERVRKEAEALELQCLKEEEWKCMLKQEERILKAKQEEEEEEKVLQLAREKAKEEKERKEEEEQERLKSWPQKEGGSRT